jgi:hypothetical protein
MQKPDIDLFHLKENSLRNEGFAWTIKISITTDKSTLQLVRETAQFFVTLVRSTPSVSLSFVFRRMG